MLSVSVMSYSNPKSVVNNTVGDWLLVEQIGGSGGSASPQVFRGFDPI
jgi:hypothetical protein